MKEFEQMAREWYDENVDIINHIDRATTIELLTDGKWHEVCFPELLAAFARHVTGEVSRG